MPKAALLLMLTIKFFSVSNNSNPLQEEVTMKHSFYDVKAKKKVEAEVIEKATYGKKGNERYAFKAKTSDGRNLTAFVSKATSDKASI